jgi:H+/gluconate symporter-like permease
MLLFYNNWNSLHFVVQPIPWIKLMIYLFIGALRKFVLTAKQTKKHKQKNTNKKTQTKKHKQKKTKTQSPLNVTWLTLYCYILSTCITTIGQPFLTTVAQCYAMLCYAMLCYSVAILLLSQRS